LFDRGIFYFASYFPYEISEVDITNFLGFVEIGVMQSDTKSWSFSKQPQRHSSFPLPFGFSSVLCLLDQQASRYRNW
jgi:hypothetical protein